MSTPCLSTIPGHEAAKRALEVAAVLPHNLRLVGPSGGVAPKLSEVFAEIQRGGVVYGVSYHFHPCPCGWLGDVARECSCTPRMVEAWTRDVLGPQRYSPIVWSEVPRPTWAELRSRPGEATEAVRERVLKAREHPIPTKLDTAAESLAKAAYERLNLTPAELGNAVSIAGSVARLAWRAEHEGLIRAPHIAEAIGYLMPDRGRS